MALVLLLVVGQLSWASGATSKIWGVPIYPGAILKARTEDGDWKVAQYQVRERTRKVIDFYSGSYGDPVLEGGKWRFATGMQELDLEVAEIALGPDAGQTIVYVRHRGKESAEAPESKQEPPEEKPAPAEAKPAQAEAKQVAPAAKPEILWGVPVFPGAVRHGVMEAGAKRYVTYSTTASSDVVVEYYVSRFGKPSDLPPNRKLVKAAKQSVEIVVAPGGEGGAEITFTSTKPIGK